MYMGYVLLQAKNHAYLNEIVSISRIVLGLEPVGYTLDLTA